MTPLLRSAARRASRKVEHCAARRVARPCGGVRGRVGLEHRSQNGSRHSMCWNGVAEDAANGDVLRSVARRAAQSCGGASGPSRTRTPGAGSMVDDVSDMRCSAGSQ